MNEPILVKRIIKKTKDGKVKQQGYLYATKVDETVNIGFSLCNKQDKYDSEVAKYIAIQRANQPKTHKIPSSIKSDVENFIIRCQRYFKDAKNFKI